MNTYSSFIFKDYSFDEGSKTLKMHYGIDDAFSFTETYKFDFEFAKNINPELLERALTSLFYVAGVSYYKTFVPKNIVPSSKHPIDQPMAEFLSRTYRKGLGEFFYVNKIDPKTPVLFPANATKNFAPIRNSSTGGKLVGLGGGKDSLVTVEMLKNQNEDFATWSVGHKSQLEPLVNKIGKPHFYVEREWDQQLLSIENHGAMNGHVPISAVFACVGFAVAVLSGRQDVIVSNEQSANEPTLQYQGTDINHQYSKSQIFEQDFQNFLQHVAGDGVRYYSFLRSLSELRIAEIFAQTGFETYKDVFSSCNRAYTHDQNHMFWCGECSKCAFVFLALTPFVERAKLESLWHGKNLLLDSSLQNTYKKLLGIEGEKPLDCVGEIKESRAAMKLAEEIYPELKQKYVFELPDDYDYKKVFSNEMPPEIQKIFTAALDSASHMPE